MTDGPYRIRAEFTEEAAEGQATVMEFTKGPTPWTKSFPDAEYFKDMSLDLR